MDIWENMKDFAFRVLGRAIYDSTFSELMKPFAHPFSIVLAAQGIEILIKSRIAKEHPLLIFDKLPKASSDTQQLTLEKLLENAATMKYSELPDRLWATTGFHVSSDFRKRFIEFGNLRNQIIHFGYVYDDDYAEKVLKFIFEVVEPMCYELYDETFVRYAEEWDDVIISESYLPERLNQLGIKAHDRTEYVFKMLKWNGKK